MPRCSLEGSRFRAKAVSQLRKSEKRPWPAYEFREIAGKTWYTPSYTITMSKTVLQ